jgi:hypothetical protein
MEKIIGQLKQKEAAKTQNDKDYWRVTVANIKGSIWPNKFNHAMSINEGDMVEAEFEVNGKYTNFESITLTDSVGETEQPTPPIAAYESKAPPVTTDERTKSIVAQVIVKATAETISGLQVDPKTLDEVIPWITTLYVEAYLKSLGKL